MVGREMEASEGTWIPAIFIQNTLRYVLQYQWSRHLGQSQREELWQGPGSLLLSWRQMVPPESRVSWGERRVLWAEWAEAHQATFSDILSFDVCTSFLWKHVSLSTGMWEPCLPHYVYAVWLLSSRVQAMENWPNLLDFGRKMSGCKEESSK